MSRRVMITGIVDTDIYKGDVFVNSVSKEGDVTSAAKNQKEQDAALPNLAVMRLGDVTTLNLPADNEYSILLHVDSLQPVFIDDVLIFSGIQQEIGDTAGIYTLDEGDYELYYDPESGEPTLTALSGRIITKFTSLYSYYSTALSMAEESNASDHITIISALTGIMLFLFLLCLIAWS